MLTTEKQDDAEDKINDVKNSKWDKNFLATAVSRFILFLAVSHECFGHPAILTFLSKDISAALYMGTTLEFRSKLKACELRHEGELKRIERCKMAVSFGHMYGKKRNKKNKKKEKKKKINIFFDKLTKLEAFLMMVKLN